MTVRVVLVEDHVMFADALSATLAMADDIEVVGVAVSSSEVVDLTQRVNPDVVVMDVSLPGVDGIRTTQALTDGDPELAVLVLTMHDDEATVVASLTAGARGFLPKTAKAEELVTAIHTLARGDSYIDPSATRRFLDSVRPVAAELLGGVRLTEQEQRVLRLLADGRPTKGIARELTISDETVKTHLRHIYQKLGVADRVQAVAAAIRAGLIE